MTETIITNNTIIHNHNMDKFIQQLRDIKNILHSNTTYINQMIHSVSEIATKLGFEISLPSPIPLSPAPPTPLFAAAATSTTGDSDLDNEKSPPTDNSETISQPSNPDLIEMLDLKAATTLVDSEAAALRPPSVRASPEQKKQPLCGAGLNQPPSSFWEPAASQPPFADTVGLLASFAGAKAHNVFDEMHKTNRAADEATFSLNTKAFSDLDSPKQPDLELLSNHEISYHTFNGATNLKVMQLTTSILNQPTAALVDFGGTYNCLYPRIVVLLGLEIERSAFFPSMKNGDKMKSKELSLNDCMLFLLGECKIKARERKKFIFDPGGILDWKSIFDLEDKVVFKGTVMIRNDMVQPLLWILESVQQPLLLITVPGETSRCQVVFKSEIHV